MRTRGFRRSTAPDTVSNTVRDEESALLRDIALAREHVIAMGYLYYMGPDKFMDDLVALLDLPPSVVVICTRLEDPDPVPTPDPELTQRARARADSPMSASAEQRTSCPPAEPEPVDPRLLARVMTMAKRRKLKAYHTENWIALTDAAGETRYSGTVAEVYEALKADTVTQLPDPVAELRERLTRAAYIWTLQDDGDGRYTLCRGDPPQRMFTDTLEGVTIIAASRILNTVPNWGYPE